MINAVKGMAIARNSLPANFPTHRHGADFWEPLGRAVGTYGFLEEMLGKAILALTAATTVPSDQFEERYKRWKTTLARALTDPLGKLIKLYGDAVRASGSVSEARIDSLLAELGKAATLRNALCHGSWQSPDARGRSVLRYVDRRKGVFQTAVDVAFLEQVQRATAELACDVIDTVTLAGLQFPGSSSPGKPIV